MADEVKPYRLQFWSGLGDGTMVATSRESDLATRVDVHSQRGHEFSLELEAGQGMRAVVLRHQLTEIEGVMMDIYARGIAEGKAQFRHAFKQATGL